MCNITARNLTAADTPLESLVEDLGTHALIFVLEGRKITGFVTPADLGSAAARTYFYLKLSALEVAAADYLRQRYPHQEDALSALSNGRRSKAQELVASLLADDAFIDIVASLSLQDLVSVLGKDEPFRARIRESGIGWDSLSHGLTGFRNDIMHPSRPFGGATRKGAQGLSKKLRGLTTLTEALISLRQLNVLLP
ncbi:hypothetical protein SAMN05216281_1087 [Cryobacterium luteum]|nr:hypothetical protein SAMN05216281_1087 [Cryobacterium luteum]